ncbi:hypothetical protein B0J11DRAFT_600638 [Dendryphion nanum]|uniref:Uncharacterized protein n=1 Tax=Dendryphion nanum TaxID=256645 RepID=A0A9P9E6Z8_9PLEO|nr:hypothetical protein B0J11DRAFT_600638 [Dendryphion nanum]
MSPEAEHAPAAANLAPDANDPAVDANMSAKTNPTVGTLYSTKIKEIFPRIMEAMRDDEKMKRAERGTMKIISRLLCLLLCLAIFRIGLYSDLDRAARSAEEAKADWDVYFRAVTFDSRMNQKLGSLISTGLPKIYGEHQAHCLARGLMIADAHFKPFSMANHSNARNTAVAWIQETCNGYCFSCEPVKKLPPQIAQLHGWARLNHQVNGLYRILKDRLMTYKRWCWSALKSPNVEQPYQRVIPDPIRRDIVWITYKMPGCFQLRNCESGCQIYFNGTSNSNELVITKDSWSAALTQMENKHRIFQRYNQLWDNLFYVDLAFTWIEIIFMVCYTVIFGFIVGPKFVGETLAEGILFPRIPLSVLLPAALLWISSVFLDSSLLISTGLSDEQLAILTNLPQQICICLEGASAALFLVIFLSLWTPLLNVPFGFNFKKIYDTIVEISRPLEELNPIMPHPEKESETEDLGFKFGPDTTLDEDLETIRAALHGPENNSKVSSVLEQDIVDVLSTQAELGSERGGEEYDTDSPTPDDVISLSDRSFGDSDWSIVDETDSDN